MTLVYSVMIVFVFFFFLFLTTISTNTNIMVFLFSNNLLSVGSLLCFQDCNQVYIFLYKPVSFKNDKTLSMWMFSNKSLMHYSKILGNVYKVTSYFAKEKK